MLDLKSISLQFDARLSAIKSFDTQRSELSKEYRQELEKLKVIDLEMNGLLLPYSGAKLLEPGKLIRPFPVTWRKRLEAMT